MIKLTIKYSKDFDTTNFLAEFDKLLDKYGGLAVTSFPSDETTAHKSGAAVVSATECKGCGKPIDVSYCSHCNKLWAS